MMRRGLSPSPKAWHVAVCRGRRRGGTGAGRSPGSRVLAPVVAHRHGSCRWETGAVAGSVRMKQVPARACFGLNAAAEHADDDVVDDAEAESGAAPPGDGW